MTTSPVTSITDELLAEIEQYASNAAVDGARSAAVRVDELRGLLARLRQAEKDAERYRWLWERGDATQWTNIIRINVDDYDSLDSAIDTAMQGHSK